MDWSQLTPHLTGFAHVATVTADGRPHVAKVAPAVEGDLLWLAMNTSSTTVRNLRQRPLVALMFEPQGEVYVHAAAELVDELDVKRRLWASTLFPFTLESFFGPPESDIATLVRLSPTRATLLTQDERGITRQTWRATDGAAGGTPYTGR